MLILVRHALPLATPATPPERWELSAEGRAAAERLAVTLPPESLLLASSELKAKETLAPAGEVVEDARLGEVARPGEPWSDDFRRNRRRYLEGDAPPGWEPWASVAERFGAALDEHFVRTRPLVAATHGMAMTVWLMTVGVLRREDAADFWAGLAFPDAILVTDDRTNWRRWT